MKNEKCCHILIKKTAMEMAGAFYEENAGANDLFYKFFPNQNAFIKQWWGQFVSPARSVLMTMLKGNYPQQMKDEIYDAIILDKSIPASRRA